MWKQVYNFFFTIFLQDIIESAENYAAKLSKKKLKGFCIFKKPIHSLSPFEINLNLRKCF